MATCLFTGKTLDKSTPPEHTIPRRLGGRITSTEVSSREFNNACSNPYDAALIEMYHPITKALAPALPQSAKTGQVSVDVPDQPAGSYRLDENGLVGIKGATPVAWDDETGRPTSFIGPDAEKLHRVAEQQGWPKAKTRHKKEFLAPRGESRITRPLFSREAEIAALKSALLTFDCVLRNEPEKRFTRSAELTGRPRQKSGFMRRDNVEPVA
ncbi:MAG: hypothetical protein ACOC8H_01240, partial [bacterium]